MPQTITREVFSFDELSDAAKERARDWYREASYSDTSDFDCEIEEFATVCDLIGIDLNTHNVNLHGGGMRQDPNIWWSVGYTQSDHATFEGTYDYKPDACVKLRQINNDDKWEPLRIAIALARIQADNAFGLRATIKGDEWPIIDVIDRRNEVRDVSEADTEITELMKDLASYLYQQLRDQSDYLHSDEHVDESITINEYTFDEEGNRDG